MSLQHVGDGGAVSAAFIQAWKLLSSRSGLFHIIELGVCPAATWPFIHVVMSEHHVASSAAPGVLLIQVVHAPSTFASCVAAEGDAVVLSPLLAIGEPDTEAGRQHGGSDECERPRVSTSGVVRKGGGHVSRCVRPRRPRQSRRTRHRLRIGGWPRPRGDFVFAGAALSV